jgi:hypothetical protein
VTPRLALVLLVAALLAGCASHTVKLINDHGDSAECHSEGMGWGVLIAGNMVGDCVSHLEAQGYHTVP